VSVAGAREEDRLAFAGSLDKRKQLIEYSSGRKLHGFVRSDAMCATQHRRALALATLVLFASHGMAANVSFLKNSPISFFTEQDIELMMAAADDVLADDSRGAKREWKNSATGNFGQLEVLGAFKAPDGRLCKRLRVTNNAKAVESRATYSVCLDADGVWKVDAATKPPARAQ
jgi:hypothetical protein